MTGFDSTWYHGPFAAGFFQSGDTGTCTSSRRSSWPGSTRPNSEIFHAVGMLAFDRDLLSPLLNLGWFVGCLVACWCIGRPYRVAPWSLALGGDRPRACRRSPTRRGGAERHRRRSSSCSLPSRSPLNAWRERSDGARSGARSAGAAHWSSPASRPAWRPGPSSTSCCRPRSSSSGSRWSRRAGGGWRASRLGGLAGARRAAATGTCATSSTPATRCPGSTHLGPISLPGARPGARRPRSAQRPRLPDRRLGLVGLVPARPPPRPLASSGRCSLAARRWPASLLCRSGRRRRADAAASPALASASAAALAWLVAPTSASGPDGHAARLRVRPALPGPGPGPRPAPCCPTRRAAPRPPVARARRASRSSSDTARIRRSADAAIGSALGRAGLLARRRWRSLAASRSRSAIRSSATTCENRYADPTFTTPGLNAAFALGPRRLRRADRDHQHPPVPAVRHRPLQPGPVRRRPSAPTAASSRPPTCRAWRRAAQRRRLRLRRRQPRPHRSPASRHIPPTARWTEGPDATRRPAQARRRSSSSSTARSIPSACPLSALGGWRGRGPRTDRGRAGPRQDPRGSPYSARRWTTSATSRSSPTSTTASRRWPTASSRSPAPSTRRKCRRRCSTRWTSSASAGSRSRRRRCGSSTGPPTAQTYHLHLIDTPGHVDFSYEVSRSLAACEGALLVVDAAQGVEAQTVANTYLAIENGLELIPVINKVDLPGRRARAGRRARSPTCSAATPSEALRISAKTGEGVVEVLEAIVERIPPPQGRARRRRRGR